MYYPRHITSTLEFYLKTFGVVALTGPRQAGKSTLLRHALPRYHYESLDDPKTLERCEEDPLLFLKDLPRPAIVDEAQRNPKIFPALKAIVDQEPRKKGQWILSGSASFGLMQKISESLSGRVGILELLPFSWSEARRKKPSGYLAELLRSEKIRPPTSSAPVRSTDIPSLSHGFLPGVTLARTVRAKRAILASYVTTYVEKDLRSLANVTDLSTFRRLITLAAARTGEPVNAHSLASELGVATDTVRRWLQLLEASYQVFLLPPYFANVGKRVSKTPRMYFFDTGLVSTLTGLEDERLLRQSTLWGKLFETWIISEVQKIIFNQRSAAKLFYWRTLAGAEVDLVLEVQGKLIPIEIKAGPRPASRLLKGIRQFMTDFGEKAPFGLVICSIDRPTEIAPKVFAVSPQYAL
ncbi:MAG: ATP-binding protein [Pseudomonadota bacterium]